MDSNYKSMVLERIKQLKIPGALTGKILEKMEQDLYDFGEFIYFVKDESRESNHQIYCELSKSIRSQEDIFLIDHMWSFPSFEVAKNTVIESPHLLQRIHQMAEIQDLPEHLVAASLGGQVDDLLLKLAPTLGRYSIYSPVDGGELEVTTIYLLDEVGYRLTPHAIRYGSGDAAAGPVFQSALLVLPEGYSCLPHLAPAYTIIWPIRDGQQGEECSVLGLPRGETRSLYAPWALACPPFEQEPERENEEDDDKDAYPPTPPLFPLLSTLGPAPPHTPRTGACTLPEDPLAGERGGLESVVAAVEALGDALRGAGFTAGGVARALQLGPEIATCLPVWELSEPEHRDSFASVLERQLSERLASPPLPLAGTLSLPISSAPSVNLLILVRLFILGLPVPSQLVRAPVGRTPADDAVAVIWSLEELLGGETTVRVLVDIGLLVVVPSGSDIDVGASMWGCEAGEVAFRSVLQLTPVHESPARTVAVDRDGWPAIAGDLIVATDFAQTSPSSILDPVMYIGPDSLGLLATVALLSATASFASVPIAGGCWGQALDLCSGSGVQGLHSLWTRRSSHVTLVEKSVRAVRFARFNVILNRLLGHVRIVTTDVTSGIADALQPTVSGNIQTGGSCEYDLILVNPPYIPSPSPRPVPPLQHHPEPVDSEPYSQHKHRPLTGYGDGGETGDGVLQAVIEAAGDLLLDRPGAALCAVSNLVNVYNYPQKIRRWWAPAKGSEGVKASWFVWHGEEWSVERYAELVHPRVGKTDQLAYADWLRGQYAEESADPVTVTVTVANAVIVLVKGLERAREQPALSVEVRCVDPQIWQVLGLGTERGEGARRTCSDMLAGRVYANEEEENIARI